MSTEPLFWYRPRTDGGYEGPLHNGQIEDVRKASGAWVPLFAGAAPAAPVATPAPAFSVGVHGVGVIDDSPSALAVYFNAAPNNDDIRALHEIVTNAPVAAQVQPDPRTPADTLVNGGALILALNALRRAGKNEIADELEKTVSLLQQPVSGADGWSLAKKVRRDLDRQSCPDAYMRIAVESIVKHYEPPQSPGNPGQPDHLPDATKKVGQDQFRDAAQMIEPSGNASRNAVLEEAAQELMRRRALLSGQNVALNIQDGLAMYDICIDAIRNLMTGDAQPSRNAGELADYPTRGMNLGQRIAHVGGRENAQGYVEFGSPMAVHALIQHVLRDFHRQGRVNLTPAKQTTDPLQGAADWLVRDCGVSDPTGLANRLGIGYNRASRLVDAARKEPGQ